MNGFVMIRLIHKSIERSDEGYPIMTNDDEGTQIMTNDDEGHPIMSNDDECGCVGVERGWVPNFLSSL